MRFKIHLLKEEKIYLFLVSLVYICYSIYNILYYPIYIDEALTYEWFTSKGFISSLTYYPEPNNHVLFSLITNFFEYLPIQSILKLRLPNLIIGLSSTLIVYFFLKNQFGHKRAIIPHILFTFSYVLTFYTTFARGYMLLIFCTLICVIYLMKILNKFKIQYLIIYTLLSVIGFCSHPLFLYSSLSLILVYVLYFRLFSLSQIIKLILSHIVIAFSTVVFYTPIIYYNGLNSLIGNNAVEKRQFENSYVFFENLFSNYDYILGIKSKSIFIFLLVSLLFSFLFMRKFKKESIVVFVFLFSPYVFSYIQGLILSPRYLSYLIFPFVLGVAIIFFLIDKNIRLNKIIIYFFSLFILFFQVFIFRKSHSKSALPRDLIGLNIFNSINFDSRYTTEIYFDISHSNYEFFTLCYYLNSNDLNFEIDTNPNILNQNDISQKDILFLNKKTNLNKIIVNNYKFEKNIDSFKMFKKIQ